MHAANGSGVTPWPGSKRTSIVGRVSGMSLRRRAVIASPSVLAAMRIVSSKAPIEIWLAAHAPADLRPPPQTSLIARDLAELGEAIPASAPLFSLGRAVPGHALGTAWVLAGSALGNRAIAKAVTRIGGGAWPVAFLGDGEMMAFWQGLRARIERPAPPAEAAAATRAAEAVFAHFLAVTETGHETDRPLESASR